MEVNATHAQRQNGTHQSLKQCVDQLICICNCYDKLRRKSHKTIGIIADEQDWIAGVSFPVDHRLSVKIGFEATGLREQMKKARRILVPGQKSMDALKSIRMEGEVGGTNCR